MAIDSEIIEELRRARDKASAAAKAAGDELETIGMLYIKIESDKTARAALKPQVERAIRAYENLNAQTMALVAMLNELEA
jgi:hypothetical protein